MKLRTKGIWSELDFGKHYGKSLPQILFIDPDYFFWACEKEYFHGMLKCEAKELNQKVRAIKIPKRYGKGIVVEYITHPSNGTFAKFELLPRSQPEGSNMVLRKSVIDLSIPRRLGSYDKLGYKLFIRDLKFYLFESSSYKMTRKRCEKFFEDDNNFLL